MRSFWHIWKHLRLFETSIVVHQYVSLAWFQTTLSCGVHSNVMSFIACNACLKYTCNSSAWCNALFEQSLCLHNLVRYFNFSFNITFENSLIWCNNRGWINDYKLPHPSGSEATPNYNISSTILCCWYGIFPLKNSLWFVQNCGHTTLSLIHLSGAHYSKSSWSSCPLPNFVVTLMFF